MKCRCQPRHPIQKPAEFKCEPTCFTQIGHEQLREDKKGGEGSLPFTSIADLYPDPTAGVNKERLVLTVSFFKQGIFKQLLTEGERYMFTWFSLITLAQQGVYDVVSSFGAMAARWVKFELNTIFGFVHLFKLSENYFPIISNVNRFCEGR